MSLVSIDQSYRKATTNTIIKTITKVTVLDPMLWVIL